MSNKTAIRVVLGAIFVAFVVGTVLRMQKQGLAVTAHDLTPSEFAESPFPVATGAPPDPPPVAAPVSSTPLAPPTKPLDDEASLMARLRSLEDREPALALDLAREGNRRFAGGPDEAERSAVVVKSLARQGRLSEARGEAETMVNRYPDSPWALEVEQQTGAHPRRNR